MLMKVSRVLCIVLIYTKEMINWSFSGCERPMAYPSWAVSGKGAMARSGFVNAVSQKSKHNL